MPAFVAWLRGINVGGKHALPMAHVRAAFAGAGAKGVATYIQSGNVVFTHPSPSATKLATALEAIAGFPVPIVLRSHAELTAVIATNPFGGELAHCMFLPAVPTEKALTKLTAIDPTLGLPSRFAYRGREIYLDLPAGIGRDKLAATVFRAVPDATTRNWRTVLKLQEMIAAL